MNKTIGRCHFHSGRRSDNIEILLDGITPIGVIRRGGARNTGLDMTKAKIYFGGDGIRRTGGAVGVTLPTTTIAMDIAALLAQAYLYDEYPLPGSGIIKWVPDSHWDNHPEYPTEDWKSEVMDGNTRQSYVAWVNSQIEQAADEDDFEDEVFCSE